jgi:hypothetical protein
MKTLLAASALALLLAGAAQARPLAADAPGLDVADRCMAAALQASGWEGALRIRLPARQDRSMRRCDLARETEDVLTYIATAKPCLARDLRDWGYRGRIRPPHHSAFTSSDEACAFPYEADAATYGASDPAGPEDDGTFIRPDGTTAMAPVPNPEDMAPRERWRVYGK